MQICQQLNQWPFPNPVQAVTQAQLNFYDEALRQLAEALKPEQAKQSSGRAKRRDKSVVAQFIEAKGLGGG